MSAEFSGGSPDYPRNSVLLKLVLKFDFLKRKRMFCAVHGSVERLNWKID